MRGLGKRTATAVLAMALGVAVGAQGRAPLAASAAEAAPPPLIPLAAQVTPGQGIFTLSAGAVIAVPTGDAQARFAATQLADQVRRVRGLDLMVREGRQGAAITLALQADAPVPQAEGYALEVTPGGAHVVARDEAGLYYGAMSLAQLLTPEAAPGSDQGPVTIPAQEIRDWPRFPWRGMMLDVARHFQPLDSVKALVDQMAAHKLNRLHLHLTDDQGWRLEIRHYPELTKVGAWRTPPSVVPGPVAAPYGGFYTQDQIRDLVAYAAARHVTIVPEIDMPGHAQAVMASYPKIGVTGVRPAVAVDWGVNPYLFNVDEPSFTFIQTVLDEVMALFPSTYVHVGGDEALKDEWKASPKVQARMRALGLKDENALQTWFIERVGQYLAAHGRRMIGWDEILEGGIPPTATIMSWRGIKGAVDAARMDHDVILSPAPTLYLDSLQSRRDDEPAGRLAIVTLADIYAYDAMPAELSAEQAHHVLGGQANVWTEYMMSPWHVTHAVYPRMDALAEGLWSPKDKRDWRGFLDRLPAQLARYRHLGVDAADSAFAVDFTVEGGANAALAAGTATVALSNQAGVGTIRYTTDGSTPTSASTRYEAPLHLTLPATLNAMVFSEAGQVLAAPRRYELTAEALRTRQSGELQACPQGEMGLRVPLTPDATTKGPVFNVNLFDACWVYPKARLDGVTTLTVNAARLARNYGLAHDAVKVRSHPATTPNGELVVHMDGCDGPAAATVPLPSPATAPQQFPLTAHLPATTGERDLCLMYTAPIQGPLYAIGSVSLRAAP
ncbi:family 20 glycosylhydrolase [Nitrospirillum sp. BR 11828]|nr:family 20 glycosylhydrolase [Nitrospirillum sp. BR 11828]MDZ5645757.1 family 20 glycosylhydrolase [Nitrospirillum sp. BR 11828]